MKKRSKSYASIALALVLLATPTDFHATTTIILNSTFNIYTITLDKGTVDLGRGETVVVQADVVPKDQPIEFYTTEPDSRVSVNVSVDLTTGRRTITIHDLTAEGDGSANSPRTITIRARLPDTTDAVTALGDKIECAVELKKEHAEEVLETLLCPSCVGQQLVNLVPSACGDGVKSLTISRVNATAASEGATLPAGYPDAAGDAIKNLLQEPVCNRFGELIGAEIANQVRTANPTEAHKKVPRDSHGVVVNTANTNISITPRFFVQPFELFVRDPDLPDQRYSIGEFVQKRPFSFIPLEPVSVTGTAHLNATLKTGDVTITFGTSWKIQNDFGGHTFADFDKATGTLELRW